MSNTSIKTPYVIRAQLTEAIIEEACTKHVNLGFCQITLSLLSVTSRLQYSVSCSLFGLGVSGFCSFFLLSTSLLLVSGGVLGWHWVSDPPLGGAFLPWPTFSLWWKQFVGLKMQIKSKSNTPMECELIQALLPFSPWSPAKGRIPCCPPARSTVAIKSCNNHPLTWSTANSLHGGTRGEILLSSETSL